MTVANSSKIGVVSERMSKFEDRLEGEREFSSDGLHHVRPSVSSFFSGRTWELEHYENYWRSGGVRLSRSMEELGRLN